MKTEPKNENLRMWETNHQDTDHIKSEEEEEEELVEMAFAVGEEDADHIHLLISITKGIEIDSILVFNLLGTLQFLPLLPLLIIMMDQEILKTGVDGITIIMPPGDLLIHQTVGELEQGLNLQPSISHTHSLCYSLSDFA